jgi:hypothetical protein
MGDEAPPTPTCVFELAVYKRRASKRPQEISPGGGREGPLVTPSLAGWEPQQRAQVWQEAFVVGNPERVSSEQSWCLGPVPTGRIFYVCPHGLGV